MVDLNELGRRAVATAYKRGKIQDGDGFLEGAAQIAAELFEAIDATIDYDKTDTIGPVGYLVELADVIIATLSLFYRYKGRHDITSIILEKMDYNDRRQD